MYEIKSWLTRPGIQTPNGLALPPPFSLMEVGTPAVLSRVFSRSCLSASATHRTGLPPFCAGTSAQSVERKYDDK